MNDTRTTDERIDTLADAIALLAVSGSTVFGGTDAREAVKEATRYKTLCKCGIHDSCVDCHHENTSDDDERTCIQKLHDDFHAAEERARVLKAMCEWLAEHRTHWEQPNDDVLVHHSRYRADVVPLRLAAAEEAVARAVDKGKPTAARHALYPLVKEADDE